MVGMLGDSELYGDAMRGELHRPYTPIEIDGITPIHTPSLATRLAAALAPTYESLRLLFRRDRLHQSADM